MTSQQASAVLKDRGMLLPDWPAIPHVKAAVTTVDTLSGQLHSQAKYGFNIASHVEDSSCAVAYARMALQEGLGVRALPVAVQVHGIDAVEADLIAIDQTQADAVFTTSHQVACCIQTADCLPILLADTQGKWVAAIHAGWRGLLNGVIDNTVDKCPVNVETLQAWIGPAITQPYFEVGMEVQHAFLQQWQGQVEENSLVACFTPEHAPNKTYADLIQLARLKLAALGVSAIYGGQLCSFSDTRFYSYRRQPQTGRMASLIWLD